ncbi:hypothetical protein UlMin_017056 [Ulmus minor]
MSLAIIIGLIIISIALILIRVVYRFSPRFYITATTDNMSLQKALLFETSLANETGDKVPETSQFMQIYRSREVGQSYVTSVWKTLVAMTHALWLMFRIRHEMVLCNGPRTCISLCVIGFSGLLFFYVESIARVHTLSLSELILYRLHISDYFFYFWLNSFIKGILDKKYPCAQLQNKYPCAYYVGCLM